MKYFFEIPIFRLSESDYKKSLDFKINKCAEYYQSRTPDIVYDYVELASRNFKDNVSNYRYGDLIGVIKLFVLGDQIRGELYFIKQRVSSNLKNKKWSLAESKIFEIYIFDYYSNDDIYKQIIMNIDKYKKYHKKLNNTFVDTECFNNIGRCINYKFLICD